MLGPVVPAYGPLPARICILAEAPGSEESQHLRPLVGLSGRELSRMLRTIGVNLDDCFRTNVFSRQPPANDIAHFGTPNPSPESRRLGPLTSNPQRWVADEHLGELERLRRELVQCDPHVVVALGNTATWALLGQLGISNLRGVLHLSDFLPSRTLKVIPTFHPAAVLRQWDLRGVAIADLDKAYAESHYPEARYDNTELWLAPTLEDLDTFGQRFLVSATEVAMDIETKRGHIDCISLAPSPDVSICVPFWFRSGEEFWPNIEDELAARAWVNHWLAKPDLVKVFQNGLYDLQYLRVEGFTPVNCSEDTMLAHHSLYSELRKGLGFLGSVYANRPGWKSLATFKKEEQLKRDD